MMKRVLVVDDYEDARLMLSTVFEGAGFEVAMAANGAEAVESAKQHRPDVVIMDLFMPVMDGIEATRLMKADESLRHVPVIAYTAKPSAAPNTDLFAAICAKPCEPDRLLKLVNQAMWS